jgi:AcrR family transcriptional regulator
MKTEARDTRTQIFDAAMRLFRRRGFEKTTMRDIAKAAGVSLGAAYYYFPSKDAVVLAYYDESQAKHTTLAREGLRGDRSLEERLRVVLHTKLDTLSGNRKLLSALFRSMGDPASELSIFSASAKHVRDDSIALFHEALADEALSTELRTVTALAFWSLSMGLVLYFIHDASPKQEKTRRLVDQSVALLAPLATMAPLLAPMGEPLLAALREAGLAGHLASVAISEPLSARE